MRSLVVAGIVTAVLTVASTAPAGPVKGGFHTGAKIDGHATIRYKVAFKGNERACVIVLGDHRPVVPITVSVYDKQGRLVARHAPGRDVCAAIWYPPRDATYVIEVENGGQEWNQCYIAME